MNKILPFACAFIISESYAVSVHTEPVLLVDFQVASMRLSIIYKKVAMLMHFYLVMYYPLSHQLARSLPPMLNDSEQISRHN